MANNTNPNQEGWNRNTELGCDVKTILRSNGKRNPQVFNGKLIIVTRCDDGSLNLNFKSLKVEAGFTVDDHALGVCNELRQALGGPHRGRSRLSESRAHSCLSYAEQKASSMQIK